MLFLQKKALRPLSRKAKKDTFFDLPEKCPRGTRARPRARRGAFLSTFWTLAGPPSGAPGRPLRDLDFRFSGRFQTLASPRQPGVRLSPFGTLFSGAGARPQIEGPSPRFGCWRVHPRHLPRIPGSCQEVLMRPFFSSESHFSRHFRDFRLFPCLQAVLRVIPF